MSGCSGKDAYDLFLYDVTYFCGVLVDIGDGKKTQTVASGNSLPPPPVSHAIRPRVAKRGEREEGGVGGEWGVGGVEGGRRGEGGWRESWGEWGVRGGGRGARGGSGGCRDK